MNFGSNSSPPGFSSFSTPNVFLDRNSSSRRWPSYFNHGILSDRNNTSSIFPSTKRTNATKTHNFGNERDGSPSSMDSNDTASMSSQDSEKSTKQSRVHHIPIQIESSDKEDSNEKQAPKISSKPKSFPSTIPDSKIGENKDKAKDLKEEPQKDKSSSNLPKSSPPRVYQIPILVEEDPEILPKEKKLNLLNESAEVKNTVPLPGQGSSVFHKKNFPERSKNGHNVRVPVVNHKKTNFHKPTNLDYNQKPCKKDPIDLIQEIKTQVEALIKDVDLFNGIFQDKTYRYLDEMLTRCMLKLDNVSTEGRDDVRNARKSVLCAIEQCLSLLEKKGKVGAAQLNSNLSTSNNSQSNEISHENEVNEKKPDQIQDSVTNSSDSNNTQLNKTSDNESCIKEKGTPSGINIISVGVKSDESENNQTLNIEKMAISESEQQPLPSFNSNSDISQAKVSNEP